jgi:transposase-like protein
MSHGINANIVHRWLRERAGQASSQSPGFVASEPAEQRAHCRKLEDGHCQSQSKTSGSSCAAAPPS